MARSITTAFKNSIKAQVVQPFFAVQLEFSTGTLYFWTGYGSLTMTAGGSTTHIQVWEMLQVCHQLMNNHLYKHQEQI